MKSKSSLKTKLQVVWFFLFKHGEGIMVNCGVCRNTRLTLLESHQDGNTYFSKYKCRSCGAIAENKEVWEVR